MIFMSNEDMYTKIQSEDYDVLIPSDYMIQRLVEEDKMELDFDKILILKVDNVLSKSSFSIQKQIFGPIFCGSVGLVYGFMLRSLRD